LEKCEDDTHIPEMGIWESFGTLEISKLDYRGFFHLEAFFISLESYQSVNVENGLT
jgi:hypothetical protein